jgi:hypothetical protein
MATPTEVARELLRSSEQIARKVTTEPTGVKPGYSAALGGTVTEDGRLRYVAPNPGAPVAYGEVATPITVSTANHTINFDGISYDPQGLVTTGASWRCLLPSLGWWQVWVGVGIDQNSNDIGLGEYWDLHLEKGATGMMSTITPGGKGWIDKIVWPVAVAGASLSGAGQGPQLTGITYVRVDVAPADFYLAVLRNSTTYDRIIGAGSFFVAPL